MRLLIVSWRTPKSTAMATRSPVRVVAAAMVCTMTSWLVSIQSLVHPVSGRSLLSGIRLAGIAMSSLLVCSGSSLTKPITVPFHARPGKSRVLCRGSGRFRPPPDGALAVGAVGTQTRDGASASEFRSSCWPKFRGFCFPCRCLPAPARGGPSRACRGGCRSASAMGLANSQNRRVKSAAPSYLSRWARPCLGAVCARLCGMSRSCALPTIRRPAQDKYLAQVIGTSWIQPLRLGRRRGCSYGCSSPGSGGGRVGSYAQVRTLADLRDR